MKKWQILQKSFFRTAFFVPLGFCLYFCAADLLRDHNHGYVFNYTIMTFLLFFTFQFVAFAIVALPTCIAYYLLAHHVPLKMKFLAYPLVGFAITAPCSMAFSILVSGSSPYEEIFYIIMLVSIPYVLLFSLYLIGFETGYIQRLFSRKDKQV